MESGSKEVAVDDKVSKKTKNVIIAVIIVVAIVFVVYFFILFEMYRNNTYVFNKDEITPDPSLNVFYPTGDITPLTQDQIEERAEAINNILTTS